MIVKQPSKYFLPSYTIKVRLKRLRYYQKSCKNSDRRLPSERGFAILIGIMKIHHMYIVVQIAEFKAAYHVVLPSNSSNRDYAMSNMPRHGRNTQYLLISCQLEFSIWRMFYSDLGRSRPSIWPILITLKPPKILDEQGLPQYVPCRR
ncbi:hypothetical protein BCV71DRAFT_238863 [Rhizopus microsporus]|uniref:Uncharacterized protein n=1 Tax=Rhizopus microsporus TaxID=58291 RepID=A0A1X0RPW8_RHIZD|nr:hypothetical protein BCV71DRAFT_238863 [Rhizopus microsporus]